MPSLRAEDRGTRPPIPRFGVWASDLLWLGVIGACALLLALATNGLTGAVFALILGAPWVFRRARDVIEHAPALIEKRHQLSLAEQRLERVRAGEAEGPFCLLLRSYRAYIPMEVQEGLPEVEISLAESLPCDLFGVGASTPVRRNERMEPSVGIARIRGPRWREEVRKLANRAVAIFVIPFESEGILEELELLASDEKLVTKTLVVMPPSFRADGESTSFGTRVWTGDDWYAASKELQRRDSRLKLPDYDPEGLIFRFDRKGRACQVRSLRELDRGSLLSLYTALRPLRKLARAAEDASSDDPTSLRRGPITPQPTLPKDNRFYQDVSRALQKEDFSQGEIDTYLRQALRRTARYMADNASPKESKLEKAGDTFMLIILCATGVGMVGTWLVLLATVVAAAIGSAH